MTDLARTDDPTTSQAAAAAVETKLKPGHLTVLDLLRKQGPYTDDELADAAVMRGVVGRHEQARRLIRTLRETHGLIVPFTYMEAGGEQATRRNVSGRYALLWRAKD